jgi:hypothetical protein
MCAWFLMHQDFSSLITDWSDETTCMTPDIDVTLNGMLLGVVKCDHRY